MRAVSLTWEASGVVGIIFCYDRQQDRIEAFEQAPLLRVRGEGRTAGELMSTPADPETAQDKKPTDVTVHVNTKSVELRIAPRSSPGMRSSRPRSTKASKSSSNSNSWRSRATGNRSRRNPRQRGDHGQRSVSLPGQASSNHDLCELGAQGGDEKSPHVWRCRLLGVGKRTATGENVQISITFKKAKEPHEGSPKPGGRRRDQGGNTLQCPSI